MGFMLFFFFLNKSIISYPVTNCFLTTVFPGQTVQTQIRLLEDKQSDHVLSCLYFCLHFLLWSNFTMITTNFEKFPKFRNISAMTVIHTFSTFWAIGEQLSLAIEIMVRCSHALNWS